ncbi:hypothetical protein [Streptomyces sp. VRA16 Mangrove soil]|uniref:hypothetical protein n=1 Tax=Streptomyces sp. VRA16 Mangrove soil TaxID=2817434 RepID=UPI0027DC2AAC|nr:hypothetical protein [Streptomyces sp. VRA16 Mangrove soil]
MATGAAAATAEQGGGPERPCEAAALTGSAKLYRPLGDDITFTFDAQPAAQHTMKPEKA